MKKFGPYVGVTGYMLRFEVNEALKMVPVGHPYRLMVGVLMSLRTLKGQKNRKPNRYPEKDTVAGIFVDDDRTLNLVHYNTNQPETLFEQMLAVTEISGPYLDGFQLNICWPELSHLERYREKYPDKFLLLQIGGGAMKKTKTIEGFEEVIKDYLPIVDAILIDSSGGEGKPFNLAGDAEYLRAVLKYRLDVGIGIAGGIEPLNLHRLIPLLNEFPSLSFDLESGVRTPEDEMSLDKMLLYLKRAFLLTLKWGS